MIFTIVIPTREGGFVDEHFGHCEYFTLYKIDSDKMTILEKKKLESPEGCGCKSNIIHTFLENDVDVMLAGGIGGGAIAMLESNGIEVYNGCSGSTDEVIGKLLRGEVFNQGACCAGHEGCGEHHCGHHSCGEN